MEGRARAGRGVPEVDGGVGAGGGENMARGRVAGGCNGGGVGEEGVVWAEVEHGGDGEGAVGGEASWQGEWTVLSWAY